MPNRRKTYGEDAGRAGNAPPPCPSCGCRQRESVGGRSICRHCGREVAASK